MGQVLNLRAELAKRRMWDRLAQLRPWRYTEKYDLGVAESRERPGQMQMKRR